MTKDKKKGGGNFVIFFLIFIYVYGPLTELTKMAKEFKKIEHVYKTTLLKELVYNKRAGLIYCIRKAPREKSSVEQTVVLYPRCRFGRLEPGGIRHFALKMKEEHQPTPRQTKLCKY